MSLSLRFFLILGSFGTLLYFIRKIRKSKLKINHSIFWMVFGLVLLFLACMPSSIYMISTFLGFQSPVNLVYVLVIFMLVLKLFTNTMKLSKLNEQVAALTQALAIYQLEAQNGISDRIETETAVEKLAIDSVRTAANAEHR